MGMGLLGAMGGLGEAGMQIGNQMMQGAMRSELQREHLDYLAQERDRTEKKQEEKRKAIGQIISNATSGKVDVEGPPTEDGQMPQRQMNRKEKLDAAGTALLNNGEVALGQGLLGLASREDTAQDKYYNALLRQTERNESKEKLAELADATKRRGQNMAQGRFKARLDSLRSGGTRSGSGAGGRGGDGHDKFYDDFFKADEKAGLNFQDTDGYALFKDVIRQAKIGNRDPDILAAEAVRRISEAREAATVNGVLDRAKYRELLDKIRQPKNPTLIDDPSISDASIIEAGRKAAESEVGGDEEVKEPWWKGKATADDFLQ